jgi:hypothetical protein
MEDIIILGTQSTALSRSAPSCHLGIRNGWIANTSALISGPVVQAGRHPNKPLLARNPLSFGPVI